MPSDIYRNMSISGGKKIVFDIYLDQLGKPWDKHFNFTVSRLFTIVFTYRKENLRNPSAEIQIMCRKYEYMYLTLFQQGPYIGSNRKNW